MTSQCAGKNKIEASKKKNPELNNIGNMKKSKFYKYHGYMIYTNKGLLLAALIVTSLRASVL